MPQAPGTIDPDRIARAASALPTGVIVLGTVALIGAACAAALGCGCNPRRKR
jgi:hypothetical protein